MNTASKLTPAGKIIWSLKVARFWHDGDGTSFLWNLWNPLSWPAILIIFVAILLVHGITGLKEFPGLTLTDYWKEHKSEREFF
jgi:succinate dehydrogenase hydrophobic anchor subunit